MIIEVTTDGPVPPYEQIRSQVSAMVASGTLPVGYRLPSIRQLANDLGLAPGTVARAYRELEAAGIVVSRVRHGTTVAAPAAAAGPALQERLEEEARRYAAAIWRLGVSPEQALNAVREQFARGSG